MVDRVEDLEIEPSLMTARFIYGRDTVLHLYPRMPENTLNERDDKLLAVGEAYYQHALNLFAWKDPVSIKKIMIDCPRGHRDVFSMKEMEAAIAAVDAKRMSPVTRDSRICIHYGDRRNGKDWEKPFDLELDGLPRYDFDRAVSLLTTLQSRPALAKTPFNSFCEDAAYVVTHGLTVPSHRGESYGIMKPIYVGQHERKTPEIVLELEDIAARNLRRPRSEARQRRAAYCQKEIG